MTQKYPVMDLTDYNALTTRFTDVNLIAELRLKYGDGQVAAAIRNGKREFIQSPESNMFRTRGYWRLRQFYEGYGGPLEDEVDAYLKWLQPEQGEDIAQEMENIERREAVKLTLSVNTARVEGARSQFRK